MSETDTIRESFNEHDTTGGSLRPTSTRQKSSVRFDTDAGEIEVDPTEVVNKINQLDAGKSDHFDAELPALPITGTGQLGDDCGDDIPRFCSDCLATSHVGRTCYRQGCPRCWKGWDRRRATSITSKLEALRRYRESFGSGWQGHKHHHLVLSPPPGYKMNSDDPLGRTFEMLKEVCAEIGVDTGYLFYHPYRGPDGDDRGFWKSVLPDGEPVIDGETLGDADPMEAGTQALVEEHDLSHEPHFHAVVLSEYVGTENVVGWVEEQTGWTIHRITKGDDSDVSLYNEYDLARSVSYCLSHTAKTETRYAVRPFGEVANFSADETIERQMDAAVRSVAVNTTGLKYDSVACSEDRDVTRTKEIEVEKEKVNLGAAHGAAGPPETETVEIEEEGTERCDGRMLEITAAPAFLDDEEVMNEAENSDELRAAWVEWREKVDDAPDPDPWVRDAG